VTVFYIFFFFLTLSISYIVFSLWGRLSDDLITHFINSLIKINKWLRLFIFLFLLIISRIMNTGACLIIKKRFSAFLNLPSFIIISLTAPRLKSWFFIHLTHFKLFYIFIIVFRISFKKTLLKRSRVVFIKFVRKIYLRYSKRVFDNLTHHYKYKGF
jgi:hypothetical protein